MLFALPIYPFYDSNVNNETYLIRATDKDGFFTNTPLMVVVNVKTLALESHEFSLSIVTDYSLFTRSVLDAIWLTGNLSTALGSASTNITILRLTQGSVIIHWYNRTIVGPYTCPVEAIRENFNFLNSDLFKSRLSSLYLVSYAQYQLAGICKGFTLSTTTTSTSTIPTTQTLDTNATNSTISGIITTTPTTPSKQGTTLDLINQTTSLELVRNITIPLGVLILLLIILLVALILWRKQRKYKGKSRFDDEGNMFRAKNPVLFDDEPEVELDDRMFNDLYADEGIQNPSYQPATPEKKVAPPPYKLPPASHTGRLAGARK